MAVFSFIDLPDVLTHKKGEHIVKKKEKKQIKTEPSIKENSDLQFDINGNPINPKTHYIGKNIILPIADANCSLYRNDATIILFGKSQVLKAKVDSKDKLVDILKRTPISFDKEVEK